MADSQTSPNRTGEFSIPPNTDFRAIFFANAAEQQHIKLFIGDSKEPAAYHLSKATPQPVQPAAANATVSSTCRRTSRSA